MTGKQGRFESVHLPATKLSSFNRWSSNLGSDCVFTIRSCHPKTQSTFEINAAAHSNLRLTQLNESLSIFWLQFHQDLNKNWFEQNLLRCHFFIQNVESIVEPDCRTLQTSAHRINCRICYLKTVPEK